MLNFFDFTQSELASHLQAQNFSAVHGRTLFRQIYRKTPPSIWDLPDRLGGHVLTTFSRPKLRVLVCQESADDGTVKFLIELMDGKEIETVLIPEKGRLTLCISSQVGCAQACVFCSTGRMGLKRNLSAGEMIGQIMGVHEWLLEHPQWLAARDYPSKEQVSNVVFMGMGEPLDNVDEVIKAVRILTDPYGLNLAPKRVTVSTSGHLPGLRTLIRAQTGVSIALSLHSGGDALRSRIMPINQKYPIAEILTELRAYTEKTRKKLFVQYTLIAGLNDSVSHAEDLVTLLTGMRVKVNLIPLNEFSGLKLKAPAMEQVRAFYQVLAAHKITTMIRFSKGKDISAACGQLRRKAALARQNS